MQKPEVKPNHPFFSSGPCSKRPGWNLEALNNAFLGRSHRAKNGKAKLNEVIVKSKELLGSATRPVVPLKVKALPLFPAV